MHSREQDYGRIKHNKEIGSDVRLAASTSAAARRRERVTTTTTAATTITATSTPAAIPATLALEPLLASEPPLDVDPSAPPGGDDESVVGADVVTRVETSTLIVAVSVAAVPGTTTEHEMYRRHVAAPEATPVPTSPSRSDWHAPWITRQRRSPKKLPSYAPAGAVEDVQLPEHRSVV